MQLSNVGFLVDLPRVDQTDERHTAQVAILLCTLNSGGFLEAQLASIESQEHRNWRLVASDDGSTDDTCHIIEGFAARHPDRVELRQGPRRGNFVVNFLSLVCDTNIDADFFAFCDQDDIWFPEKLTRAIEFLSQAKPEAPAVYCGRTQLIDEVGKPYGYSPPFDRKPSFRNAVIQSIGGGNTMVLNRAARDLVSRAPRVNPVSHDWWTYQVVTSVGGICYYDAVPTVAYRQHGRNTMGANIGWAAGLQRAEMVLRGRFAQWTLQNLEAFKSIEHLMTEEGRQTLRHIEGMRDPSLISRLRHLHKSGVYRQTLLGNVGLVAAVILKRL